MRRNRIVRLILIAGNSGCRSPVRTVYGGRLGNGRISAKCLGAAAARHCNRAGTDHEGGLFLTADRHRVRRTAVFQL